MLSSNVIRAFALFVIAVNGSPCRPTTTLSDTTAYTTSTATVINSTNDLYSTVVESATETGTPDVPITTSAMIEEPITTTAIVEGSTTTEAASPTTEAGAGGSACSTSDDCTFSHPELS